MKYYISDLHFGHGNVIKFDNRPFETVEEMDKTLIDNWNNKVTNEDSVYVLGDMFWNNALLDEVLPNLNGSKYLILGNHDRLNATTKKNFVWIKEIETIEDGDKKVVLCHYPLAHWKNQSYGYIHLFGHIHTGRDSRPFAEYAEKCKELGIPFECYNVGCMMPYMNYTPQTLETIRKGEYK